MLKRAVKNAARAAMSSGGESDRWQQSRQRRAPAASSSAEDDKRGRRSSEEETVRSTKTKKTQKTRSKSSNSSGNDSDNKRKGAVTSGTDTPRSRSTAAFRSKVQSKLQRMWNAGKMKRTPLLERVTIEAVHSALAGKDKKRVRTKLLELFARYDADATGSIDDVRFVKCISKIGVHLTKATEYDALVSCFAKSASRSSRDGDSGDERSGSRSRTAKLVDYAAFVDFASNVRDSERLSAIADKLSRSIDKYDDKHDQSTTTPFDIYAALTELDRKKRQWLPSATFAAFLTEHERPVFKLSSKDVAALTERFEYEYDAGELGVDYEQFARWVQPQLHLDVKALHRRVRDLVQMVHERSGWDVNDVFRAIDRNDDGDVSCAELKDALLEMGLPLTDAQIRCLLDEYDSSGDGRVQLDEFTALFPFLASATTAKSGKSTTANRAKRDVVNSSDGDSAGDGRRKKTRASSNVNGKKTKNTRKNTFSWDIGKAFARKQPARGTSTTGTKTKAKKSASAAKKHANVSSSSDDASDAAAQQSKRSSAKRKPRAAASSDDESSESSRRRQAKTRAKRTKQAAVQSSSVSDGGKSSSKSSSERSRRRSVRSKVTRSSRDTRTKHTGDASLTDTDNGRRTKTTRTAAKKSTSKRAERTGTTDDEAKASSSTESPALRSSKTSKSKTTKAAAAAVSSPRRRRERQLSTVSAVSHRSTKAPHSPSKTQSRRTSAVSATAYSKRHSRPQRVKRTRSRSQTRQRRRSSVAFDGSTSSAGNSEASSSGLDVEQLRQLKRTTQNRDNDVGESDDDDNGVRVQSRSDGEYEKHLKRSLRRAFDFFDLDQSDAIEKRELSHVLRALGHEFTTDELDAAMLRADVDQNGALDFREFVAFVKHELRHKQFVLSKRREMEIRQAFESLDADRNGVLDESEFEYLVYKVLGVELSVEEQDALLDFVDANGDGRINEDEFIAFMKVMESFHTARVGTRRSHTRAATEFLESLDGTSRLAMQAMKKLVRGAPIDLDRNLLMFFGVPTNFRPAISSAATCRALQVNTLAHVLSFPSPQMIVALGQDPSLDTGDKPLAKGGSSGSDGVTEYSLLQQAESYESHAIVSLKRAVGVPKPFDTREDDVLKRCVHVCLFQEQETLQRKRQQRRQRPDDPQPHDRRKTDSGAVVGNVHEIPVYWHAGEEDVWEFSKKATKEDKYKFLVRTNSVNDHLYLLVEFVVVLRIATRESERTTRRSKHRSASSSRKRSGDVNARQETPVDVREMVCCWCKVPIRTLLAKRVDVFRSQLKLWGGTAHAPIDIEQDEVLRRRTGWRALTNVFKTAAPPGVGIKSAPVGRFGADMQECVRKMPATLIAPFLALPILAEYMTLMKSMLASAGSASAGVACEPVLKLLPQIIDDHEALTIFRRVFDAEMAAQKTSADRQTKFCELVLRMWPSQIQWRERLPATLLTQITTRSAALGSSSRALAVPASSTVSTNALLQSIASSRTPLGASVALVDDATLRQRTTLLQTSAQGKLRFQDVRVASAPFHVREVAFERMV